MSGLRPLMIFLITAPSSSKTYRDARRLDMCGWCHKIDIAKRTIVSDLFFRVCTILDIAAGLPELMVPIRQRLCPTYSMRASIPSTRRPASNEIISKLVLDEPNLVSIFLLFCHNPFVPFSRCLHSRFFWSEIGGCSSRSTLLISFIHIGFKLAFLPAIFVSST